MLRKRYGSHIPYCCQVLLVIPFGCQMLFQNIIPSVSFSISETKRNTGGYVQWAERMGNDNHVVVSHKLCGFQGHVSGNVVMIETVVVMPKFQSFLLHNFSQVS
jgi:TRAP-type mannitol/chloroaromatic compound transport system permease small subunit